MNSKLLYTLEIELDEDLKMSLNKIWGGVHWGVRSKFRNDWHYSVDLLIDEFKIKKINVPVRIEYRFNFKTRYLDNSNCVIMCKAFEDWLVEAWILEDDTNKYIRSIYIESVLLDQKERKKLDSDYLVIDIYSND